MHVKYIFVVVNIKRITMNKVKFALAIALVFAMSAPCFGNSVTIKRKKNKWTYSLEQSFLDKASDSTETAKNLIY